jgi:hypothetical protein
MKIPNTPLLVSRNPPKTVSPVRLSYPIRLQFKSARLAHALFINATPINSAAAKANVATSLSKPVLVSLAAGQLAT